VVGRSWNLIYDKLTCRFPEKLGNNRQQAFFVNFAFSGIENDESERHDGFSGHYRHA
jgi:hypothetical protein